MTSSPSNPALRADCAARRPASAAPTMTRRRIALFVDQADRVLGAAAHDVLGELAHILRDLDRIPAGDRHVTLVVTAEQLRGEGVTAPMPLACGTDLQLHDFTSQRSGSVL